MEEYSAGDIVLVRFHPSFGAELKRFRPAIIISQKLIKIDPRFAVIIPLTSQLKSLNEFEMVIDNPGLEKPSLVLCWYVQTIDASRVVAKLGKLDKQTYRKVIDLVKRVAE